MSYYHIIFLSAALAAFCVFAPATSATPERIAELEMQLQTAVQIEDYVRMAEIKAELGPLYEARQATRYEAGYNYERGRNPLDQGGDNCASAVTIPAIPFCDLGTTLGYAGDYSGSCANSAAPDVVYRYVTGMDEQVTFSLCGSTFDAVLHVWRGCPTAGGVQVGCNDDFCGLQSCLTLTLEGDYEYYVVVDGYSGNAGAYRFNAVPAAQGCVSASCGWVNDDCEEATLLTTPALVNGSTIGATIDFPEDTPNCSIPDGPGVWYKFAGQDSVVRLQLTSPTVPHQLYFYCGCCTNMWCLLNPGCSPTDISFALEAGVTYWLLIAGCEGGQGDFLLDVSYLAPIDNGGCGDSLEQNFFAPGEVSGSTCNLCNWCGLRPSEDALASVYIPYDGRWVFSLCGSNFDTYMYIGTEPCGGVIYSKDDTCGLQSSSPCLNLDAGRYFVMIEAWSSLQCGSYTLRVNPCPMPAPLRVVISPHYPNIHLDWEVPDAAPRNYKIYRSLDPENVVLPGNQIGVSATNSYVDSGILTDPSLVYHYAVTAFAP